MSTDPGPSSGMSGLVRMVIQIAIIVIVLLAVVGIVYLFLTVTGITLPQWVWTLLTIIVLVVACIFALKWLKTQV